MWGLVPDHVVLAEEGGVVDVCNRPRWGFGGERAYERAEQGEQGEEMDGIFER